MAIPLIIGGAIMAIGAIGKAIARRKANKKLKELQKQDPAYEANPLAQENLTMARQLLNARSPGAAYAQQNILQNQSNAQGDVERGATDSSQVLALGAAGQGQTNEAFTNLAQAENADYANRMGIYTQAQGMAINEEDKVFASKTRQWGNKVGIAGAIAQNKAAGWQDLSNFGAAVASYGGQMGGGGGMGKTQGMPQQNWNRNQWNNFSAAGDASMLMNPPQ